MKNELALANALVNAFEKADSANAKWAVLHRADLIEKRSLQRAVRAKTQAQLTAAIDNRGSYALLQTTAHRLRNTLSAPNVVSIF